LRHTPIIIPPSRYNANSTKQIFQKKSNTSKYSFIHRGASMQIYHASLNAIQQQTMQLCHEQCHHCKQSHQLISHGFVYKKQAVAEPEHAIGKRVFCSNRDGHTGCGRTIRLYLNTTLRYFHYLGSCVVTFVLLLMRGMRVQQAYLQVTGTTDPRNAYRWLNRLMAQLSRYRSLLHQPLLQQSMVTRCHPRQGLLASTFTALLQQFGQPLCACYQQALQRALL
jgi:hypothetical protein